MGYARPARRASSSKTADTGQRRAIRAGLPGRRPTTSTGPSTECNRRGTGGLRRVGHLADKAEAGSRLPQCDARDEEHPRGWGGGRRPAAGSSPKYGSKSKNKEAATMLVMRRSWPRMAYMPKRWRCIIGATGHGQAGGPRGLSNTTGRNETWGNWTRAARRPTGGRSGV